ncbi:MAG: ferredoxin family protein [Chloroflexi bacterium]|jgi:ferredoxin|nr:ferredoxin family protein [Chloroflexota bacterium]MBT3669890.1 ferredoxin family protein [Chloroflexota bacterium]MBT4001963.1 ferredoxin family protein [Chloroflexota bacterium]MBT4304792.1 ferredoxin family protein [Chloroflexota bacterium]MBT4534707.1 ferredoxin family protein [Chloroflexota bacterium]
MTHIITSLCLRDGGCIEVCPVECIVPGMPQEKWPLYYIDPDTCIDCGACIPECPYEAIFTEDEVPDAYDATGGEFIAKPSGTEGFDTAYTGTNHHGVEVKLDATKALEAGETVDLTEETQANYDFFEEGPGYWEGWEDHGK